MSQPETIKGEDENVQKEKPIVIRNSTDLQRIKLEKLMKNPEKPIVIPERPKERGMPIVPDFVRNVMGSSAGAGSGEFHVYRHLRRKEYARQKYMKESAERERLDEEYRKKLEENRKKADERTAKKRAKRLKKKQKQKKRRLNAASSASEEVSESSEESTDDETKESGNTTGEGYQEKKVGSECANEKPDQDEGLQEEEKESKNEEALTVPA